MIALALIIALGAMTVSVSKGFLGIMKRSLGSDYLLVPPAVGLLAEQRRRAKAASRHAACHRRRRDGEHLPLRRGGDGRRPGGRKATGGGVNVVSILGIDPVAFPRVSMLSFSAGREDTPPSATWRAVEG